MNKTNIVYYTGLVLISIVFAAGGSSNLYMVLTNSAEVILGYPAYFSGILGTAQLLGVVCLLLPGLYQLKEWAFAGFYFNLISALISHVVVEGFVPVIWVILCILAILTVTYILFHQRHKAETERQQSLQSEREGV